MSNPSPDREKRRRSRWWKALAALAVGLLLPVAAFPWFLGTPPARRWLMARANRALTPGGLELGSISFSWFGPTRIRDFVLRDAEGDRVAFSRNATWDRNLWQVLFDRPRYGTFVLDRPALDIERRPDGTVDLFETIKPILTKDPWTDLLVRFDRGTLRFRSAGLTEPLTASRADMTLRLPPAPGPLAWHLALSKEPDPAAGAGPTLAIDGTYERWNVPAGTPPDLAVTLAGGQWPWAIEAKDVASTGRLDGWLKFARKGGRWDSEGRLSLLDLNAQGPRLKGDRLKFDRVTGAWDVSANAGKFAIRRLDLTAPVGTVATDGGETPRVRGTLDLAALATRLPHALGLPEGMRPEPEMPRLRFDATYRPEADRIDLAELVLASRYGTLEASGSLSDLRGDQMADLRGTLTPDWNAINARLADRVEPGARVTGKPRGVTLRGSLGRVAREGALKAIDAEIGIELTGADLYGMKLGPTPIVLRARDGALTLDPIETTLNAGTIHLGPVLALDDKDGPALKLGPESSIADAEVNDTVSHRVLSFVAPVLDNATRARGRVSVALKDAVFPLGNDSKRKLMVDGSVVFNDVEFLPGPLAHDRLALIGRDDQPGLKLDEPISLTIADRRVTQHGLALPLGKLTRIELDGWVDFERNLNLTARLPVTSKMVLNRPVLSGIVEGTKFEVPIRGTLQKPEIDKDAMNLALKGFGKALLERSLTQGIPGLIERLAQPRDPNAPPPLTREERRDRRLDRRALRRGEVPEN